MKSELTRRDFAHFQPLSTRWADNDIYGHVNNVTYYAYFDSTVNTYLISAGLDIHQGDTVAFVVSSQCQYLAPVSFPDPLEIGLSVAKLGNSSVTYQLGVFLKGDEKLCAHGQFVHVFVDKKNQKPVPIPVHLRTALTLLIRPTA